MWFQSSTTPVKVSQGVQMTGRLQFLGDASFEAFLDGTIVAAESICIEKQGKVEGKIICQTCRIEGNINGSIESRGETVLVSQSFFRGKLQAGALTVEPNAQFEAELDIYPSPETESGNWNKNIKNFLRKWLKIG